MMSRLVKMPMARDVFFFAFSGQKLYLKLETTDLSAQRVLLDLFLVH